MIKLFKNRPLPTGRAGQTGVADAMRQLNVGDSLDVDYVNKYQAANIHQQARRLGIVVTVRSSDRVVSVWRIK